MRTTMILSSAFVLLTIAALGCGGGDNTTTAPGGANQTTGATKGATLEINMGDYFFDPKNARPRPGL
jgi:hypothetical protein